MTDASNSDVQVASADATDARSWTELLSRLKSSLAPFTFYITADRCDHLRRFGGDRCA